MIIPGTEGADGRRFFSPDSQSLAFGLNGSLIRVDLAALDPRATTSSRQEPY